MSNNDKKLEAAANAKVEKLEAAVNAEKSKFPKEINSKILKGIDEYTGYAVDSDEYNDFYSKAKKAGCKVKVSDPELELEEASAKENGKIVTRKNAFKE